VGRALPREREEGGEEAGGEDGGEEVKEEEEKKGEGGSVKRVTRSATKAISTEGKERVGRGAGPRVRRGGRGGREGR